MEPPATIGVCGGGPHAAAIAELAARSGARTLVHDPTGGGAGPGVVTTLGELASCALILEAVRGDLATRRALLAELAVVAPGAVLATTSAATTVTELASGMPDPARVVGLHLVDPLGTPLAELVGGVHTAPGALALAEAAATAMGAHVVAADDVHGFVVDRVARPFALEALRLLQEGITDTATVDRVVRAAGFPLGPFEREDVLGLDVGHAAAEAAFARSYGEPRWRPSPLAARLVAAGHLGRRTGQGFHRYAGGAPHRDPDPEPPAPGGGAGRAVVVSGWLAVADELRERADHAGFDVHETQPGDVLPWLLVDCGSEPDAEPLQGAPRVVLCAEGALHALDPGGNAAGFHAVPPVGLVELTRTADTAAVATERARAFFAALGLPTADVQDAPGLVLGRILAQLVNEAAFAVGEGIADAEDIDAAATLAHDHPRGPLAWADLMGLDHVVMILDGLREEYGEERYRTAPLLRRIPHFHEHVHSGEPG